MSSYNIEDFLVLFTAQKMKFSIKDSVQCFSLRAEGFSPSLASEPILIQYHISIYPENFRKPMVF